MLLNMNQIKQKNKCVLQAFYLKNQREYKAKKTNMTHFQQFKYQNDKFKV